MKKIIVTALGIFALFFVGCSEEEKAAPNPKETPEAPASEKATDSTKEESKEDSAGSVESEPLRKVDGGEGGTQFTIVPPEESGIDFQNSLATDVRLSAVYSEKIARNAATGNLGSGVSSADYDGDGMIDLYFVGQVEPNRLYRQTAPWVFEDVTEKAGVAMAEGKTSGTGPAFADIDNDGDLDLYVSNQSGKDALFVNQGDGTFVEESEKRGVGEPGPSVMAAFADYDRDGDLDIYLVRNRDPHETLKLHEDTEDREQILLEAGISLEEDGVEVKVGTPDYLYRNDGNGNFVNVTEEAGLMDIRGMGLSATWWDANGDNWPDIYVANDFGEPDRYLHNMGDGTFEEVAAEAFPYLPWFSMGSDSADLNNDGMFDVIGTDMAGTTHFEQKIRMGDINLTRDFLTYCFPKQYMVNTVFLNAGVGRFMEVARIAGLNATDWTWAVRIADYDNDGKQDVFFTNGYYANSRDSDRQLARHLLKTWQEDRGKITPGEPAVRFVDFLREQGFEEEVFDITSRPPLAQKNLIFKNEGNIQFSNVSDEWGFNEEVVSFGVTVSDLDGDGDEDIVANGLDGSIRVYRNDGKTGNRVVVRLNGVESNRFGIGAKVTAESALGKQVRLLRASRGFQGGDHPEVHFGLGEDETITRLLVEWPSGISQELKDLAVGNRYTVTEPTSQNVEKQPAEGPRFGPKKDAPTKFSETPSALPKPAVHFEQYHHDYADQLLIPYQMSEMGPGVAIGDIEGDGKEEIWLGGAHGQLSQVVFHDGDGEPHIKNQWGYDLRDDALPEDMGGLFFDADGDDDMDLYVVSGGVETGANSKEMEDRLFLNDGSGNFTRAPKSAIPPYRESGSIVCAGDYDRDGDLDLFVGARSIPQQYPAPARSRIFRNDGGKFVDATAEAMPGVGDAFEALVTSAIWSDVNGDGWIDLLVTEDWGPVRVFLNTEGKLEDKTIEAGIADYQGWWNGIAGGDVDNDGDIDFVATNWGLNSKYKIKDGKPRMIYFSDFDGNGRMDIVEAKYGGDQLLPVRGRSCTTLRMPKLAEKFTTYRKFAVASLSDIYTDDSLNKALSHGANYLSNSVLINDGTGKFEVKELPRLAQLTPSFGVTVQDFNGDGNADILMNQNFYPNQIETGPNNNSVGLFLEGNGKGDFTEVWPAESGFFVPEDSRSLAVADLNNDNWPDLVVGINDGPMKFFLNAEAGRKGRILKVVLEGKKGNPTSVGATATLTTRDGRKQSQEVYAGGSYLSQSTADLFFGLAKGEEVQVIEVRWPDGTSAQFVEGFEGDTVTLKHR